MKVNIGKGIEMDVDTTRLGFPIGVLAVDTVAYHVTYIGLRNILMDSHAGVTTDKATDVVAESRAVAEKKLAALYAGEVRVAGTREGDPVKAEAIRMASDAIKAAWRASGKQLKSLDAKVLREKAVAIHDRYLDKARERVAEAKSLTVDLGDLNI